MTSSSGSAASTSGGWITISPETEAFFVAWSLEHGRPLSKIRYDVHQERAVYGDLFLQDFGRRAALAGVPLMETRRDPFGDFTYMHTGGILWEQYKQWYTHNEYLITHKP